MKQCRGWGTDVTLRGEAPLSVARIDLQDPFRQDSVMMDLLNQNQKRSSTVSSRDWSRSERESTPRNGGETANRSQERPELLDPSVPPPVTQHEANGPVPGFSFRPNRWVLMYRVQQFDRSCRILDDDDRIVFAGSYRECEDWLDQMENRQRIGTGDSSAEKQSGWRGWLRRFFRRSTTANASTNSSGQNDAASEKRASSPPDDAVGVPREEVSDRPCETKAPLR